VGANLPIAPASRTINEDAYPLEDVSCLAPKPSISASLSRGFLRTIFPSSLQSFQNLPEPNPAARFKQKD
jgi:hypothetical protein